MGRRSERGLPPVLPVAVADAGPTGAGDFALRLTATGAAIGAGGRLAVNNLDSRWTGNYLTAGVDSILVDVNNPNPFPLTVRVGISEPLFTTVGGRWVTQGAVVPAMSGWVMLNFSLAPLDMLPGEPLASDVNVTLANVGILRVLHAVTTSFQGDPIAAQLDIDNLEAVPEPSLSIGLLVGGLLLGSLKVERQRS